MPKFIVETLQTFHECHIVEAENEEQAKKIAENSDYNASLHLGSTLVDVQKFSESKLKRWRERESYFFEGYAAIENDHLVYRKPDGTLNGNMPTESINF
jgi:hypothetical protein